MYPVTVSLNVRNAPKHSGSSQDDLHPPCPSARPCSRMSRPIYVPPLPLPVVSSAERWLTTVNMFSKQFYTGSMLASIVEEYKHSNGNK